MGLALTVVPYSVLLVGTQVNRTNCSRLLCLGSATLHKWQALAKTTMSGLHDVVPGVHVKGEITRKDKSKHETNQASTKKNENTKQGEKDKKLKENTEGKTVQNTSSKIVNKKTNKESKLIENSQGLKTKPVDDSSPQDSKIAERNKVTTKDTDSSEANVNWSNTNITASTSHLTEIVKSKLSADNVLSPNSESGSILNTILRSTVGMSSGLASSTPVTTTAKSSFVAMTTTATSSIMSVSGFPRPRPVRSQSSENLLSLIAPFNQSTESTSSSSESLGAPPNLQTGGIGLGGFVGRLVRSSSSENLAGNNELGFSRSSRSGKLSDITDMLKNSDIARNIGKASSLDAMQKSSSVDMQNKRASFHLGDSPPSAPQLEMMGDLGGFAFMSGGTSSPPLNSSPPANEPPILPATSSTRSVFDAFSGLGGFFRRPRSKSLDNLGPLPTSVTGLRPVPNSGRKAPVERSLERFDQVFGPG